MVSDGTLTPEVLAERAKTNGVELWALTDHDEIGGQKRALDAARAQGMKYLTGAEISVTFAHQTVHIVGLGFDADDANMVQGLKATRGGREQRAMEMSDSLAKVGIKGAYQGALRFVGNPELISRTHFARFLVESGVCSETNEVFRKYLTEGKPGYVPHSWASQFEKLTTLLQESQSLFDSCHPLRQTRSLADNRSHIFTELIPTDTDVANVFYK